MKRLAALISNKGTGTNLQAIIDGISSGKIDAKIIAVVSDTSKALGLKRARRHKLQIKIVPKKEELLLVLKKLNPDYICLAGWKQIILDEVIDAYPNRVLNLHPGLIPESFKDIVKNPDNSKGLWNRGKLTDIAIQNFLKSNATYAGSSIHFLTKQFDFGPVLGRCFEKILPGDTIDSLYTRLKVKENKLYADILARLCQRGIMKTIMVIDTGGRGAALVASYAKNRNVNRILVVPGNDLMQINTKKKVVTYSNLKTTSVSEILEIAKKEKIDLVDVAQDNAVEVGLVDELGKVGIAVVGPTRAAGRIEWDKAWARDFMRKYQIPSPKYQTFKSQKEGIEFVKKHPNKKWFVKAAGLAEGKGAIPGSNDKETIAAIKEMGRFGSSGKTFLLEEWLVGEEFSAFAISDGKDFQVVGFAQDHKRVNDGDQGENTGGMGCVSRPQVISDKCKVQSEKIFKKAVDGLRKEDRPYKGVLYLGGIVVDDNVYVIEFNARWGDPEAQVLLPSIKTDYIKIVESIINGNLNRLNIKVDKKIRISVAGCSRGYPNDYSKAKGKEIIGLQKALKMPGINIYGAGIKKVGNKFTVNGGRVFHLVAGGQDVIQARKFAYQAMKLINIEGDNLHYRTDIGWRDLERLKK